MKTPFQRTISALAVCGTAFAGFAVALPADAHGIWFAQRARQLALVYGVGADDLDAVGRLDKVTAVTGYDEDWQPVETTLRTAGAIPVVDSMEPVAAVAAIMDYGIWAKTADGEWHNAGLDQHPDAVVADHNWKYAVHLAQPLSKPMPLLAGHKLQIVPAETGIPQKMGEPLTVRVLYNGKPVAGADLLADYVNDPDQVPMKTDAQGTAIVPVRNQGLNVIMAIHVAPTDNPTLYKRVEERASLSFVLPHLPE